MTNVKNELRSQALEIIANRSGISRAVLASDLGVSATTSGKLVSYLLKRGAVIQKSGKMSPESRKTMLLYLNPNLHVFIYDTSTGLMFLSKMNSKPKVIAKYSGNSTGDLKCISSSIGAACRTMAAYGYEKYRLGLYILCKSEPPVNMEDINKRICVLKYGDALSVETTGKQRLLMFHLSSDSISFSFGDGSSSVSGDISGAYHESKLAFESIKTNAPISVASEKITDMVCSMSRIFRPASIKISQSVYQPNIFSASVSDSLDNYSIDVPVSFTGENEIVSYCVKSALNSYIMSI